jgi:MFS family permease
MHRLPSARERTLRSDLRHSWIDGVLYSSMVGIGETYLPAFVLAAGHGELASGLVATIPMLSGALLQLVTPHAVARMGSYRRWIVLCASVQAIAFLPFVVAALTGHMSVAAIFLVAALYWAVGLAGAPAWNTWITTLVPRGIWARYFALRTRAMHAATLAGLVVGGFVLQGLEFGDDTRPFAILFALAGIARWFSARHLAAHSEPETPHTLPTPWRDVLRSPGLRSARALIVYLLCLQVAVQVAAPFYSPYMLGELEMPYAEYMTLMASAFFAKMLVLPMLGRRAKEIGPRRLAWFGAVGIVFTSLPWYATTSFWPLLATQLIAGVFWAAFELASLLLLFEHIPERERTSAITLFNLGNSAAFAVGSLVGGALLGRLGADRNAYTTLFLVTALLRAATLLLLRRVGDGPFTTPSGGLQVGASAVRPSLGSIDAEVVPADAPRAS